MITAPLIEERIRAIYRETDALYSDVHMQVPTLNLGHKILYGPPYLRPPILFIGYQPGWSKKTRVEDAEIEQRGWRKKFEYWARKDYRLARQVQKIVDDKVLEQCVGLNSIFIRCRNSKLYAKALSDDARLQERIWEFCRERVEKIIDWLEPQSIVLIGFQTSRLWGAEVVREHRGHRGRVVAREVRIARRPALNTLHLSGCRIATADMALLSEAIQQSPSRH